MDLVDQYKTFTPTKLVEIVESGDYTLEAVKVAAKELLSRNVAEEDIKEMARIFFRDFFTRQFQGTVLLVMEKAELPSSKFLNVDELMEIATQVLIETKDRRSDFYRDLERKIEILLALNEDRCFDIVIACFDFMLDHATGLWL